MAIASHVCSKNGGFCHDWVSKHPKGQNSHIPNMIRVKTNQVQMAPVGLCSWNIIATGVADTSCQQPWAEHVPKSTLFGPPYSHFVPGLATLLSTLSAWLFLQMYRRDLGVLLCWAESSDCFPVVRSGVEAIWDREKRYEVEIYLQLRPEVEILAVIHGWVSNPISWDPIVKLIERVSKAVTAKQQQQHRGRHSHAATKPRRLDCISISHSLSAPDRAEISLKQGREVRECGGKRQRYHRNEQNNTYSRPITCGSHVIFLC